MNYLILGGNTKILKDLWEKYFNGYTYNEHGMFLQLLRPMPDLRGWEIRNWCLSNWGTRCEATAMYDVNFDNDILTFEFETAWSPPVEAVEYFCSWFGVHGRLHSSDYENFVGFYDSVSDKSCELEYNSHDVKTLMDAFDHPPLKSEYELWNTFREESFEYFKDILERVKDEEDMEDEDDE